METKLTLKLDQTVIKSAKKYAENNNRSLSKLAEDFLKIYRKKINRMGNILH
jgi:hypothetical protein